MNRQVSSQMSPGANQVILAVPSAPTSVTQISPPNGPVGLDMAAIKADVAADHVSAPADQVPALQEVVAHAKAEGYDVSFVVLPTAQPRFEMYRDVATDVQSSTGGTVIVLGPNSVGSSSPVFSRVQQEQATDNLNLTNPPQAARQMFDQMTEPGVNWTLVGVVLIVVVAVGAVLGRLRTVRRRRRDVLDVAPRAVDPSVTSDDDAVAAGGRDSTH